MRRAFNASPNRGFLWVTVVFGALCGCLGFANPLFHFPPAAVLFPAGLTICGLMASGGKRAFRLGFFSGLIFFSLSLYWVVVPLHWYGGMPFALALPVPVLMALYLSLYPAFFCLGVYLCRDRLPWPLLGILCACLFALLEVLRGFLLSGFPWMLLPSAFAIWPSLLQLLPFVGPDALTALLTLCAAWFGLGLVRRNIAATASGLILFGLIMAYGVMAMDSPAHSGRRVKIGLIQGNIDQAQKWDNAYMDLSVSKYVRLTAGLLSREPCDLVLWPETALPFSFQQDSPRAAAVRLLIQEEETPLLVGAPGYEASDLASGNPLFFNRAFLLDQEGRTVGIYDKEHLVPFGEYMPLDLNLPFLENLSLGVGNFAPGQQTKPLRLDPFSLGMLICYEAIFSGLSQDRVAEGANLLVNISNDAWFGRTAAAGQHLHLSALRAVEQGRYMVRCTNTGISAVIDSRGRIIEPSGLFEDKAFAVEARLLEQTTVYHRLRPLIIPILAAIAGVLLLSALLTRRRSPRNFF